MRFLRRPSTIAVKAKNTLLAKSAGSVDAEAGKASRP
jgi:hypothetical protein